MADGRFIYLGLDPCFIGPFAEQPRADGARVVHPGYALETDLRICHVEEAGTTELPEWLALVAQA